MWPGVWSMFMFATNEISNLGLGLTKFVARRMITGLLDHGAHRLEARSMDGHVDAQSWLETFGAAREATLSGYGDRKSVVSGKRVSVCVGIGGRRFINKKKKQYNLMQ